MTYETRKAAIRAIRSWRRVVLSAGSALVALAVSMPAAAQSAPDEQPGLEEIVVTAQRRSERLENVPATVLAVTPDALAKAGITNLQDLTRIAPGFQMDHGGGFQQPSIRGISTTTNGVGNENNVAFYIDGFFVSDAVTINTDLVNIESVQVLKGPQGTLYGRQATGGAILVKTLDPTRELSGKLQAHYARFSERKIAGYISGPISDRIGFIVSGNYRNSDGHIRLSDPTNNQRSAGDAAPVKQRGFRAKLRAEVTDNLTATLAYNYFLTSDGKGVLFTPQGHIRTPAAGNTAAVGFYRRSFNHKTFSVGAYNEITSTIELKTDIGTLTSKTAYRKTRFRSSFDTDGTYADTVYSDQPQGEKTTQQHLDFNVDGIDNVDLVLGAFYMKDQYFSHPETGAMNFGPNHLLIRRVFKSLQTKAYAFYADATFGVTDALSVGVGGRYSIDEKSNSQRAIGLNGGAAAFPTAAGAATFKRFTPRLTVRYELAPRTNIYASYSQGFRSGAFNANAQATVADAIRTIKPEIINGYEIGFKTARSMFRFEASAFYYDDKNFHVSLTLPGPAGLATSTFTGNAPKATVKGIDFLLNAEPVDRLNLTIGGIWLHARYGRFPNALGTGVNATNTLNVTPQTQDWTGKQMNRAPDWAGNISADYTIDLAEGELRISGNAKYTASYVINNPSLFGPVAPVELRTKQRFRQSGYVLLSGEIQWTDPTDHYSVGVFGANLLNKKYKLSDTALAAGDYFTPAPPITYGIKAEYRF